MNKGIVIRTAAVLWLTYMAAGCDNRTPFEKAQAIVQNSGKQLPPFSRVDSVMGYQQAHSCRMAANNLYSTIDAKLWASRQTHTAMSENERKECIDNADLAYSLEKKAAKIALEEGLKGTSVELVGYATPPVYANDTTYVIYFDKDMTKIASIKKTTPNL